MPKSVRRFFVEACSFTKRRETDISLGCSPLIVRARPEIYDSYARLISSFSLTVYEPFKTISRRIGHRRNVRHIHKADAYTDNSVVGPKRPYFPYRTKNNDRRLGRATSFLRDHLHVCHASSAEGYSESHRDCEPARRGSLDDNPDLRLWGGHSRCIEVAGQYSRPSCGLSFWRWVSFQ